LHCHLALNLTSNISHLVLITVFEYLCTQVAAGKCSQVLLVALAVTRVFVQHERCSCLDLCTDDVIPQLPRCNYPPASTLSLISTLPSESQ